MSKSRWINYISYAIFLPLFAIFIFHSSVYANDTEPIGIIPSDGIDAILVIDTSGSMRYADPERITLEAATLFMDMMETTNSRIGIVGFSGALHSVMPLTPINEIGVRNQIRESISQFVYHGWTDIGLALQTAAEMILEPSDTNNSPMILLFTDGRIELPPNQLNRTVEMSYQDAEWAIESVGSFTPIYTIGLNYDGSVNIDFLQDMAARTGATSSIIYDAALLPQLFNEIFASHIRTSIVEMAVIEPVPDTYAEILIPIESPFVSEANIIMLSNQPITSVRLFDPSGREVVFDNETYTLTSANRFSMLKILTPMMGDWLLLIQGLPDDRITVNLIYNYTVDVAMFVDQPGRNVTLFDPTLPITVTSELRSNLSDFQMQMLLPDAISELNVFDLSQNLIATIPMQFANGGFITEFVLDDPQNVHVNVRVVHPGFEQSTAFLTISYDPDMLAALLAPPVIEDDPIIDITPPEITDPIEEDVIEPTPNDSESTNVATIIIIIAGILVAGVIVVVVLLKLREKKKIFVGHLEIRALLKNGKYTALEAPDLSTFAGRLSLVSFMKDSLGAKADMILSSNVPIHGTKIEQVMINNRPWLKVTTDGACFISGIDGLPITQRRILWEKDRRLIFTTVNSTTKIEITYRVN